MITKEQFDFLFSDSITKKEYDAIIAQIDKRFEEICEKFLKKTSKSWYVYGNFSYKDENSEGCFDPEEYKEWVEIGGENINSPPGYDLAFPTRWLWTEDFEDEMKRESENYKKKMECKKQKDKEQREKRKAQIEVLKSSIKAKLTKEELKIIKFK